MEDKTHKKKRKRDSLEAPLTVEKRKDAATKDHTHSNEPLSEEHAQLLDSVVGHLQELTQDHPSQSSVDVDVKSATTKSKKKTKESELPSTEKSALSVREFALEYLRLWDEDKRKWSFKKKTQFWLLQNMYRSSRVPKAKFPVLLRYLDGLQGHQRQLVTDRARLILDQFSEDTVEGGGPSKREYKRAVAVLRVLA